MPNALYYGDNLAVLRESIADESVDLIYLDPPFNSQASYNVLYKSPTGEESRAQVEAFEDTWHWNDAAEFAFDDVMRSGNTDAAEMLRAMRSFLKENDMMAYIAMMAVRLIELHRVLKPNGSIHLHCDPTASHYLRVLLDAIFGPQNFRNEVIWKRSLAKGDARRKFGSNHDTILYYAKGQNPFFANQHAAPTAEYTARFNLNDGNGRGRYRLAPLDSPSPRPNLTYEYKGYAPPAKGWRVSREVMEQLDREGRLHFPKSRSGRIARKHYLNEQAGPKIDDVWADIVPLQAVGIERLGYPTQKPLTLLERIVSASSKEDDVVLDPFCGCGTAVHAAQKLNRQWIGIDITHLAISLIEKRLNDAFPGIAYEVHGTPKDLDGAHALAAADKYQFQWWAVSLVNAVPWGGKKKGADSGIDGIIYFKPDAKSTEKAIVSVKGGTNVNVAMIRDLGHVIDRENAKLGIFITLSPPTGPMSTEAVKAGFYETEYGRFPKIQILTIEDLFSGKRPQMPWLEPKAFRQAPREATDRQERFGFG